MQERKPETLSEEEQRRGMRLIYLGQGVGAPLAQLLSYSAFGVLLIKHMGGTDFQSMLLTSLFLVTRVLQLPVSLLVSPRHGKQFMLKAWLGCAIALAAGLGITLLELSPATRVWLFLLCAALGMTFLACGTTFWFPLLHDVVPGRIRGRFFGRMRTVWSITSFLAVIASGLLLGDTPRLWKFRVVLAVGLVFFVLRNAIIARVPEAEQPGEADYTDWKQYIRDILSRREVVVFCAYFSSLTFLAGFLGPPLVLYLERMGFPAGENVIVYGCTMFGQILALLIAGILCDHIGTKRVFGMAHVVLCIASFCVVVIGYTPHAIAGRLMPVATTLCGAMLAMAYVGSTVQLFHLAPDRGRAFFMSLGSILLMGGRALSPLVAGAIDDALGTGWEWTVLGLRMNFFQVLFSVAGVGMAALMAALYFVEDVRPLHEDS